MIRLAEKASGQENDIEERDKRSSPRDPIGEDTLTDVGQSECKRSINEGSTQEPFAIVGIGASAGGLEAFRRLFEKLPNDTHMAFVLVQHLDPGSKSALTEILSRSTSMTISEVENNMVLKPDHVYVIPPAKKMSVTRGVLNLIPREEKKRLFMPIDFFLDSLAKDQGHKAIGVVLSGTADDGSRGLKEIKTVGGITFAQEPETAKFDGMPLNAIATGIVDFVLSPEELATELAGLARSAVYGAPATATDKFLPSSRDDLNHILGMLQKARGTDFSCYRELTVRRRILRRMVLHKIPTLSDYADYLRQHPTEVEALYEDILINITSFFRDPEAFEHLKNLVFPVLMKTRTPNEPIRVWIPGCSTGEEAYSIGILLLEFLGDDAVRTPIQIFGTDINEKVIDKARRGIYSQSIKDDISPERLRNFFIKVDNGYQIIKIVRDMCVFARQDMVNDPPFSRMDLISCRNAIIYFSPVLQRKLFPILYYALKQTGFLFLGTSESVGSYAKFFHLIDKRYKLYAKKSSTAPFVHEFTASDYVAASADSSSPSNQAEKKVDRKTNVLAEADRIVLESYAPPGVIVNSDLEIIQFRGRTGTYLEPASGTPSLKLFKMVRDGLSLGLHSAINHAAKENIRVRKEGLQVTFDGRIIHVNVDVIPLRETQGKERYYLLLFHKTSFHSLPDETSTDSFAEQTTDGSNSEIVRLQHELVTTKDSLQAIVEQYELTNEQLRSANEEIQSSNEELQSMNEELETAKEELQSANEELMTLNDEAHNRNLELAQLSSDLNNIFRSMTIPILILSNNLYIKRFNPAAEKIFNLISTDIGRPITDINTNFNNSYLEQAILEVNETLVSKEEEVQDQHGRWYSVSMRPYRTIDNKIDGVVITFFDIDVIKQSLTLSYEAREYAEAIIETIRAPLVVLDADFNIKSANTAFCRTFRITHEETLNKSIFALSDGQWNMPELEVLLKEILSSDSTFGQFEVINHFPHLVYKTMLISARRILGSNSRTKLILLAIENPISRVIGEES